MFLDLFILTVSLFLLIRGATFATRYAAQLAENFHISNYVVGFVIVAFISILPEAFISINSAVKGIPEFGLGTLFGSNVADLSLVFALIITLAKRGIKIESKILKNNNAYPILLLLPLALGFDGYYSRWEGFLLILAGSIFYFLAFKNNIEKTPKSSRDGWEKNLFFLLVGMVLLLLGSHFTVASATNLANDLGVNPLLIGMLIVGLGTTMPEFLFSLRSVKKNHDGLAVGDILGTVISDATILVGIIAIINPFSFSQKIIYVTGIFMVVASFLLFYFMRSGKNLSRREGYLLLGFWIIFAVIEFIINK